MHLLFESEASKEAWGVAGLEHIINLRVQKILTATEVIFDICCHENKSIAERVAMVMQVIWNNRNN
jgi:hypothetical protein